LIGSFYDRQTLSFCAEIVWWWRNHREDLPAPCGIAGDNLALFIPAQFLSSNVKQSGNKLPKPD
jgi:hypothetical protein